MQYTVVRAISCVYSALMFMLILSAILCQEKFMFKWLSLSFQTHFHDQHFSFLTYDLVFVCLEMHFQMSPPYLANSFKIRVLFNFQFLTSPACDPLHFISNVGNSRPKHRSSGSCRHSQNDSTYSLLRFLISQFQPLLFEQY